LEVVLARVVIVDDSLLIRRLLRQILTDAGHEVVGEAEDGLRAPLAVRELRPDLVVLDLIMPGRSGMSALQHMLLIDPSLTVVVCSASLNERKVIEALRRGAKGFIVKPLDRAQVVDAVRAALGFDSFERDGRQTDHHDLDPSYSGPELDSRIPVGSAIKRVAWSAEQSALMSGSGKR
jgi:two-component system, chemotaxis family, chemotaxis protein CheY